jgi:uncharacterized protein with NRDE domain
MCLILLSLNDHPNYKLIVAANRDEFYNRHTAPAQFWNDHEDILGGRDLEAGGTWMGITKRGRIGMVTNYRDIKNLKTNAPSRGHLVSDFLTGADNPVKYLNHVEQKGKTYNGFNLIVGNPNELYYYSNYRDNVSPIHPGAYGLSNHLLDTPWPKVRNSRERFNAIIKAEQFQPDDLLDMLYDDRVAPDHELPDTGVGLARERALSSMFIKSPGYGSRCSTVVLVNRSNQLEFVERTYDIATFAYTTQRFSLQLSNL